MVHLPPITTSYSAAPKFQGKKATQAIRQRAQGPFNPDDLLEILETDNTPYINKPPKALKKKTGLNKLQALAYLDKLANAIRKGKIKPVSPDNRETSAPLLKYQGNNTLLNQMNHVIHLTHVGSGDIGDVYKINVGSRSYAFKIFSSAKTRQTAYEAAIGAYFTARKTKNMSKLLAANPHKQWMLMEYIDENQKMEDRPGKTLFEQGFFIDDPSQQNLINLIRVDYGGTLWPLKKEKTGLWIKTGDYISNQ